MADKSQFAAEVGETDNDSGLTELIVKNRFAVGDKMELITPSGNHRFTLSEMIDKKGHKVDEAKGDGWVSHPVQDPTNLEL